MNAFALAIGGIVGSSCAAALFLVLRCWNGKLRFLSARTELALHRAALFFLCVGGVAATLTPSGLREAFDPFPPLAKVWAGRSAWTQASPSTGELRVSFPSLHDDRVWAIPSNVTSGLESAGALIALVALASVAALAAREAARVRRAFEGAVEVRRVGSVRVHVVDAHRSEAFSFRLPGRAHVVLPDSFLAEPRLFRCALLHELQHHRNGDTRFVHILLLVRIALAWNPLIRAWLRDMEELQELACDQALLDDHRVDPMDYADALTRAASLSLRFRHVGAGGSARLCLTRESHSLERRVSMIVARRYPSTRPGPVFRVLVLAGLAGLATLTFRTSLLGADFVRDQRVTLEAAVRAARAVPQDAGLPIAVNDLVLAELNRYVGTPEGRRRSKDALERKKRYDAVVGEALADARLPAGLAAVPFVESGYRNREQSANPKHGAALWMFIAPTAREYGLRVDDEIDERLDIVRLTHAATRLLADEHRMFGDWNLALLAYNSGAKRIREGILATGSRDAWVLARAGYENDRAYLARIHAALIVLANPQLVE